MNQWNFWETGQVYFILLRVECDVWKEFYNISFRKLTKLLKEKVKISDPTLGTVYS